MIPGSGTVSMVLHNVRPDRYQICWKLPDLCEYEEPSKEELLNSVFRRA